jgi:hypothetical protein
MRARTILFGGATSSGLLNDTWEYDAGGWRAITTTGQPPSARCGYACDGGGDQNQNQVCCGDTFEYFHPNPPTFVVLGAGCPGTGSRVPALSQAPLALPGKLSLPWIGRTFLPALGNARPLAAAWLAVGASSQRWGSLQLPLNLGVIGAPLCTVHASLDVLITGQTSAIGELIFQLPIPENASFQGASAHLQCVVLDPQAPQNLLGLVLSNAATITLRLP